MGLIRTKLLGGLFIICASSAQSNSGEVQSSSPKFSLDGRYAGYDFYLGVLGSGMVSRSDNTDIESDKDGYMFGGSALLNYYNPKFSADLGVGWLLSTVSGDAAPVSNSEKRDRSNVSVNIAFADLNLHYRWNKDWDVGLATKTLFGGDSTYSPFSENETTAPNVYAGLQAMKSVIKPDYRMRFGLQFLSDLTEKDRQVSWVGFVFQIGILGTKSHYSESNTQYVEKIVEVEKYLFVLDSYLVNFEVKKSKLLPDSNKFLQELGRLLLKHKDEWTSLEIEGHTDKNGDFNYNQTLSVERAQSAKNVFTQVGIASDRIITRGYGPSKPIDNNSTEVAFARNRRVEIVLNGLKDQNLIRKVNELKQKMATPRTCKDGICN